MKCGEVYRSVAAWQKLSSVNMNPKLAYKILKYTKAVGAEYDVIEKQRIALVHELTGTKLGEEAKIEPDTEASKLYAGGFQEILLVSSDLQKLDVDFEDVVNAVDEKSEVLTVSDLSVLESFFGCEDCACDDDLCPRSDGDCLHPSDDDIFGDDTPDCPCPDGDDCDAEVNCPCE